jgi:hypothetical protein
MIFLNIKLIYQILSPAYLFSVLSQVIVLRNGQNNNLSVVTKIAIQINTKLGCAPWLVNIPRKVLDSNYKFNMLYVITLIFSEHVDLMFAMVNKIKINRLVL